MLLVEPNAIPLSTRTTLERLRPERLVLLGGTQVVSRAVEEDLEDLTGVAVQRRGGDDRYATSRLIAELDDPSGSHLVLATGANFPDGLAAGPFAARTDGVLLLVPATHDASRSPWGPDQHRALLDGFDWADGTVTVVGGGAAVADAVLSAVLSILRSAVPA